MVFIASLRTFARGLLNTLLISNNWFLCLISFDHECSRAKTLESRTGAGKESGGIGSWAQSVSPNDMSNEAKQALVVIKVIIFINYVSRLFTEPPTTRNT